MKKRKRGERGSETAKESEEKEKKNSQSVFHPTFVPPLPIFIAKDPWD